MIELYYWPTPNGHEIAMFLEEAAVPYGGKSISVFESGAVLAYLAEKTGKLLSPDLRVKYDTLQWLFWQVAGLGPMAGQNHHFGIYASEKLPCAINRFVNETNRLYGVFDKRLADREYLAGDYSLADIASYPWIIPHARQCQNLDDFPHLKRWFAAIQARPATLCADALTRLVDPNGGFSAVVQAQQENRGRHL
jgi:GST-like protein